MESRIEELEVSLRAAEARAEMAVNLALYLCDQLAGAGVITWGADDLKRQFLIDRDFDISDPAMEFARLDLEEVEPGDEGASIGQGADLAVHHIRERERMKAKIADQIKHDRDPS